MKGWQFVWYRKPRFFFRTFNPKKTQWAYIYDWVLGIGFLEIRKWSTRKLPKRRERKTHHMRNPKSEENIKVMLIKEHNKVHQR